MLSTVEYQSHNSTKTSINIKAALENCHFDTFTVTVYYLISKKYLQNLPDWKFLQRAASFFDEE